MYNSCKEAHIAVNDKIQQINANRQESIRPQYIDIALNEAVDVLLTQKIKAFEETGRYYDDLQALKCTVNVPLYIMEKQTNRGFTFIPANYLHGIAFDSEVIFDKFKRYRETETKVDKFTIVDLNGIFDLLTSIENSEDYNDNIGDDSDGITFEFSMTINGREFTFDYPIPLYESKGIFEILNFIFPTLYKLGINVHYEYYTNLYESHCLIFHTDEVSSFTFRTSKIGDFIPCDIKVLSNDYNVYNGKFRVIDFINGEAQELELFKESKFVGMDLVSDVQRRDILQTYHNAKNRHIHPICTIEDDRLYVDMSDNFIVTSVNMVYLRKPMLFNWVNDNVAELPFKTEIINLAVQKLLGKLKDDGYQVAINETNALK